MHAHAGSLLSLLDVRVGTYVRARIHESAARLCNRVGGSEEQLRVAADLPPSLFPSAPSLSVPFQRKMKGDTHRVVLFEVWGLVLFFFELVEDFRELLSCLCMSMFERGYEERDKVCLNV